MHSVFAEIRRATDNQLMQSGGEKYVSKSYTKKVDGLAKFSDSELEIELRNRKIERESKNFPVSFTFSFGYDEYLSEAVSKMVRKNWTDKSMRSSVETALMDIQNISITIEINYDGSYKVSHINGDKVTV